METASSPTPFQPRPTRRWSNLLPVAVFAVLSLLIYADCLFDNTRVPSAPGTDLSAQFLSWREFGFGELAAGQVPLWNPHLFSGTPYMAWFQAALFYPPNWLHLILPLGLAITWYCVLHTFLMGYFTSLWVRYRGASSAGQTLAGVMAMFSGQFFLHVYAGHLPHLGVLPWVPLIFLTADALADGQSWRWTLLGTLAVAMQILAGHPQYVYYTALTLGLYLLLRLIWTQHRVRLILGITAIYLAGALITALQLLPGIEASGENIRTGGLPYIMASQFSAGPQYFLTLLSPYLFGHLQSITLDGQSVEKFYFGAGYLWDLCFFVGFISLFLACLGWWKSSKADKVTFGVVLVTLVVLSAGQYTPLHKLLWQYLPLFGSFRVPAKFMAIATILLAPLSARGLDWLRQSPSRRSLLVSGGLMGALAILLLATAAALQLHAGSPLWNDVMNYFQALPFQYQGREFILPGYRSAAAIAMALSLVATGTVVGLLALLLYLRTRWAGAWIAICVLAIIELTVFAAVGRGSMSLLLAYPEQWAATLQNNPQLDRCVHLDPQLQDLSMSLGAYEMWGSDPGVLKRYGLLINASQGRSADIASQYVNFQDTQPFEHLYRMFRLRWVFFYHDGSPAIVECKSPMQQVQLIGTCEVIPDRETMFARLLSPDFDPEKLVYLEQQPAIMPAGRGVNGSARVVSQSTNSIEIEATCDQSAILLVTDNYAKGWQVRALDDSSQKHYDLLPANYCLRGIPLSAGRHHLVMEYLPAGWSIGKWVTLAGLLAYAAAGAWALRKRS